MIVLKILGVLGALVVLFFFIYLCFESANIKYGRITDKSSDPKPDTDDDSADDAADDEEVFEERRATLNGVELSETPTEVIHRGKHTTLIRALIGVLAILIVLLGYLTLFYYPNKTYDELDQYATIAFKEAINKVPDDALKRISSLRSNSIFLDKEKAQNIDDVYKDLEATLLKWQEIKAVMKSENYYLDDDGNDKVPKDPQAPSDLSAPNDDPGPGPDTNNGVGAQYAKGDHAASSQADLNYRPYRIYNQIHIMRVGFDPGDIQPRDFPTYDEYVSCMEALKLSTGRDVDIVSKNEYRQQMRSLMEMMSIDGIK
ncbi:hypothetical protein J5491_02020 [Candidatus Saccharibacteria bacterium]|nr:hypothetical protein [Candidatus Saccharibacteria bacterium]